MEDQGEWSLQTFLVNNFATNTASPQKNSTKHRHRNKYFLNVCNLHKFLSLESLLSSLPTRHLNIYIYFVAGSFRDLPSFVGKKPGQSINKQ